MRKWNTSHKTSIKWNHEHGQITVLMVFAVVALFGAAALSIDGGMLYFQRRAAQGAADNAAMTGALAIIKGYDASQIDTIVHGRTRENGFDNDDAGTTIEVNWPPVAPNPYAGNMDFIQVIITSEIPLAFVQLVYSGPMQVTVEATSHAKVNVDLAPGVAMLAANSSACKALWFNGNPTVDLSGGGSIAANSQAGCGCDPLLGGSGVVNGPVQVNVIDGGEISVSGCWGDYSTNEIINPAPIPDADPKELNEPPVPDCTGLTDRGSINTSATLTLQPGIYESIKLKAGADVTLAAGLYCLNGLDGGWSFETKGGSTLHSEADGVMIYLMDTAGGFSSAGGSQVYINASTDLTDASGNQWAGMLIYVHPDNTSVVAISGTSNSWYQGSIYALNSHCDFAGTAGGIALQTQVICDTVKVHGL
jgi:hypothetical protein